MDFLRLIRAEHWVKNLFLFIPAFFGGRLFEPIVFGRAAAGFFAFSLVASAVYIFNDCFDAEHDRNHPDKKNRPIAARQIRRRWAVVIALLMLGLGLAWMLEIAPKLLIISLLYFSMNALYSVWLKHIALIDISIIGLGFLFRVFAGGAATGDSISNWLIVLTFLLAMILGLAKRRGEYLVETKGHSFRKALEGYNLPFIDSAMVVTSTVTIVAYLMYCFSKEVIDRIGSDRVFFTAFFVILGILRYLQLTLVFNRTESPTRALLTDRFLQILLVFWAGAFAYFLYFRKMGWTL